MKYIPLKEGFTAIVDEEDYEKIKNMKVHYTSKPLRWQLTYSVSSGGKKTYYATKRFDYKKKYLHHLIYELNGIEVPKGMEIDHKNHNGLDCRKSNMRIVTKGQNRMNSSTRVDNKSGYKGVYWMESRKKWRTQINNKGKNIHVGLYETKVDAAIAYNDAAVRLFGEYAQLNAIEFVMPDGSIEKDPVTSFKY